MPLLPSRRTSHAIGIPSVNGQVALSPVRVAAAIALGASLLAFAGCVPFVATGATVSQERDIDAVTAVVLDTSGDLSIAEGAPSLVIHAPEGAIDRLTSDVEGDTLILGTTPGPGIVIGVVRYVLTLPDLEAIELNSSGDIEATVSASGSLRLDLDGSGEVEWSGLDAERVTVTLSGSGGIELSGRTRTLSVALDGSGSVDAGDLDAREAEVSIGGSGDIDVRVRNELVAAISGSGRVTYSGDPAVEANVSGSGAVVPE